MAKLRLYPLLIWGDALTPVAKRADGAATIFLNSPDNDGVVSGVASGPQQGVASGPLTRSIQGSIQGKSINLPKGKGSLFAYVFFSSVFNGKKIFSRSVSAKLVL